MLFRSPKKKRSHSLPFHATCAKDTTARAPLPPCWGVSGAPTARGVARASIAAATAAPSGEKQAAAVQVGGP